MKAAKISAIRRTMINLNEDIINAWRERNNVKADTIMGIGEYILENGCDAEGYESKVKEYFIKYVDEHTTILLPKIHEIVMTTDHDFIKEDWEEIFKNLFPVEEIYDVVVYSVNSFTDTDQIGDNNFSLFFNYNKAIETFNKWKSELMDKIMDEDDAEDYEIAVNSENFVRYYNDLTDAFYQIDIEKKPVM